MLEADRAHSETEVRHVDRCLSCLSCMRTCPSGGNYMHLVDHGRHHIETRYTRALPDRLLRGVLAWLMPRPAAFRWAMALGRLAKPLAMLLPSASADPGGAPFLRRLKAMLQAAPGRPPGPPPRPPPPPLPARRARRPTVARRAGSGAPGAAPPAHTTPR